MKKNLLCLLLLLLAMTSYSQQDEKAKGILDDMSNKYKSLEAYKVNFINKMENKVENVTEQHSGNIIVKGDKFILSIGDQEVYNNGETIWTYFSDVNEVNIDDFEPDQGDVTPVTIYSGYQDGYKYRFVEEKKSGPRTFYVVELQPEPGSEQFEELIKIRLEIDTSDNTVAFMEIFDKTGTVYSYKMSGFSPQANVSDTMFNFDVSKHPGVEVVDLR